MRKLISEFIGTFALVFAGTGAIVINEASGGAITHPGIAEGVDHREHDEAESKGNVSGAHLNPAVTTAFAAAGRLPWRSVPSFIGVQVSGALSRAGAVALGGGEGRTGRTGEADR